METAVPFQPYPHAHLVRRLGALLYDSLLVAAIAMLVATLWTTIWYQSTGEAQLPEHGVWHAVYQSSMVLACFLFYGGFWIHGGQTLGMRAWKIRVQQHNGQLITWQQALRRFLGAIFSALPLGLGYWWWLVDRSRMTWHDHFSNTVVVQLPR